MPSETLGTRALNRALLERQMLLRRRALPVAGALERLVGLQAQVPNAPYVGLWSRLERFRPAELGELLVERRAARLVLMRATMHLVTARDALALRPVVADILARRFAGTHFARALEGLDLDEVVAAGRAELEREPRTAAELGRALAERWPDRDPPSLAAAAQYLTPLVQLPPRGVWGRSGRAVLTPAEAWLGRRQARTRRPDETIVRYLGAFGPATVADIRQWSGLTGLREAVERLRPRLRTFRDEQGRELLDVHDGPLPDPRTPAPPRFLPDFDNVLLAHADRARIIPPEHRGEILAQLATPSRVVLVDGFVRARWSVAGGAIEIDPLTPLSKRNAAAVRAEANRLERFLSA